MRKPCVLLLFCACATVASAQVAEFSVSGGSARTSGNPLVANDATYGNVDLKGGFRLDLRMTLNTWRFFGHEFGYGYNRSSLASSGQTLTTVSMHSGFYDFMAYALPEGSHIRPFVTGGAQFNTFVPAGGSVYYGGITKFGINYGGGIKIRTKGPFGFRADFRQYNVGKPDFSFFSVPPSGRLKLNTYTVGVFYSL